MTWALKTRDWPLMFDPFCLTRRWARRSPCACDSKWSITGPLIQKGDVFCPQEIHTILARMNLPRFFLTLFLALLAPIHSFAIQLKQTVNGADGSSNIQSGGTIKVTWVAETGDPAGFDIDLVHPDGSHGLLRPNIELVWGSVVLDLPSGLPDGTYANGIYQYGNPLLAKGPTFYIGNQPKPTSTNVVVAPQTSTVKTTISESGQTTTVTAVNSAATTQASNPSASNSAPSSPSSTGKESSGPSSAASSETRTATTSPTSESSTIVYAFTSNGQVYTTNLVVGPTSSAGFTAPTTSSGASKVPVGAIVGGVVGGVVLIIAIILIIFFLRRRRRTEDEAALSLVRVYSQPKSERIYPSPISTQPVSELPSSAYEPPNSAVMRENHELQERIRALENQQVALVSRLLINGVMAPDYADSSPRSSEVPPPPPPPPPPLTLPADPRQSFHKSPV